MTTFSIRDRYRDVERMSKDAFDLVVIGGGITGAGIALDAATRGLSVALIEKGDFASGTSSRSSRLIHGGLRYLRHGDLALVHEALRERRILSTIASNLVSPLPFLLPILDGSPFDRMRVALSAGLWLYDLAGGIRSGRFHRTIDRDSAMVMAPFLQRGILQDGLLYWDAVNDDARTTLSVVRTAAIRYGVAVANYCPALDLETASASTGISGPKVKVTARDLLSDTELIIAARAALIASGVWSDTIEFRDPSASRSTEIRPAKGIHITVPRNRLPGDAAVLLPVPDEDRFIFAIPWGDYRLIGTTDTDYAGPLDDPAATQTEIAYLLDAVNAWSARKVKPEDVTASFAGLRPLVANTKAKKTTDISRRHVVKRLRNRVGVVYGGKFTTWRSMAAETVDFAGEQLGLGPLPRSVTAYQHLEGTGNDGLDYPLNHDPELPLSPEMIARLVRRYGRHIHAVIALCAEPALAAPISPDLAYLKAEVVYAARYEMAATLDDVMTRRTRATTDNWSAARDCAESVGKLLQGEMKWKVKELELQLANYLHSSTQYHPRPTSSRQVNLEN